MEFLYVLLSICLGIFAIIGGIYFFNKLKEKKNENSIINKEIKNVIQNENNKSFFPMIQVIEDNNIIPSEKNLIKNEIVKNTLTQIDNMAPKTALMSQNSKTASEILKNGRVLFSASVEDANKMLEAGGNNYYGTQVDKIKNIVNGKEKNLFTGQTKLTKETELANKIAKQQITNVGMNAASMVVGQYYMSEINNKLADMKKSIDCITNFQTSEYKSRIISIMSKIDEITKNQVDILSKEEARKNSYNDVKDIEAECTKLLGQANEQINNNIRENNLNAKQYFEKVQVIEEWYQYQQMTLVLLIKIGDLRFALANGSEKSSLSHHQYNNYLDFTNKVNEKLKLWHSIYIEKFGIDIDKQRKKGYLFEVREKTIGLINENWSYDRIENITIEQISCQTEPKYYDKFTKDKKDEVILIQKYNDNYYNVPSENNN